MSLTAFLIAVVMMLYPGLPSSRAQHIAESIAAVTDNRTDGALLAVTNFGESTFREDVEKCLIVGDGGKAIGAYQIHPWLWGSRFGREWVCNDPQWSARLALYALGSRGSIESRIARYMGRSVNDKHVQWRAGLVRKVLRHQGS